MINQVLDIEIKDDKIILDRTWVKELSEWGGKLKGYLDGHHLVIVPAGENIDAHHPYISRYENVCGGEPVIVGTRVTVRAIVEYDRLYHSVERILRALPHLTHAQIEDALGYYADHTAEVDADIARNEKAYDEGAR